MTLAVLPWETEGKLDFSEINQKATGKEKKCLGLGRGVERYERNQSYISKS